MVYWKVREQENLLLFAYLRLATILQETGEQ